MLPSLLFRFSNTHCYFKLCERGHVNDTHGFLTALDFGLHDLKPVGLVESLALLQGQKVYRTEKTKGRQKRRGFVLVSFLDSLGQYNWFLLFILPGTQSSYTHLKIRFRTSLVAQWLRIGLSVRGHRLDS